MLTMVPNKDQNNWDFMKKAYGLTMSNTVDALVALGADKNTAETDMNDVNDLSKALSLLTLELNNPSFATSKTEQMDLKSLKKKYTTVDWKKLVERFLIDSSTPITESTMFIFFGDVFPKVFALLESTKPRVIANLVALDVLAGGFPAILPKETSKLLVGDVEVNLPIDLAIKNDRLFQLAIASLYVKKAFGKDKRTKAQDIVDTSIKEMKLLLSQIKWMDNATKQKAIQKADAMLSMVGYNDEIINPTKMRKFHDGFLEKFNSSSLVNNQVFSYVCCTD